MSSFVRRTSGRGALGMGVTRVIVLAGIWAVLAAAHPAPESTALTLSEAAPPKPQNVVATAVSSSQIDVAWAPVSDENLENYNIYRDGVLIGTSAADDTTFSDTGLESFTRYQYRVSAVDDEGDESRKSDRVNERTLDGSPPSAPANLQGAASDPTTIKLEWSPAQDPETDILGYVVYRDGAVLDSTPDTKYDDKELTPFTSYTYEVSAVNGHELEGPLSDPVVVMTPDATEPTEPTDLAGSAVSATQIDLTWTAANDPESGIVGYTVFRDGNPAGTTGSTSFSDTGLDFFTEYGYAVSAINGSGQEGSRSPEIKITTPDGTPPTAPSGAAAVATSSVTVDVSWQAASDPESGVVEYTIYRDGAPVGTSATTTFTESSLAPGTTYVFEISATNGVGLEGPLSGPAQVTTPEAIDTSPPSVPQNLATSGITVVQVTLSWSASTDPETGVSEYRLYRDGSRVGVTVGTTLTDTGLEPDTSFEYRVSAVNGDGVESAQSPPIQATTLAQPDTVPPAPPTNLRVAP
ncbi:MAG: fibronectin type III domain-containing protein [Gemmatimonadota bacterium]